MGGHYVTSQSVNRLECTAAKLAAPASRRAVPGVVPDGGVQLHS